MKSELNVIGAIFSNGKSKIHGSEEKAEALLNEPFDATWTNLGLENYHSK